MIGRALLIGLVGLSLGSCSRLIEIRAAFQDGGLVFIGDDDDETFYPWCLSHFAIVEADGRDAWRFELSLSKLEVKTRCGPNLPIKYGVSPPDAKVISPPRPLEHGKLYFITGNGGGAYEGAFRYEREVRLTRRVTNVAAGYEVARQAVTLAEDAAAANDTVAGPNSSGPDEQTFISPCSNPPYCN